VLEGDVEIGTPPLPDAYTCKWDAAATEFWAMPASVEEVLAANLALGGICERLVPWQAAVVAAATSCWEGGAAPERSAVVLVRAGYALVAYLGRPIQCVRRPISAGASVSEIAAVIARPIMSWGKVSEIALLAPPGDAMAAALHEATGVPIRSPIFAESAFPSDWLSFGAERAEAALDMRPHAYRSALDRFGWIERIERLAVGVGIAAVVAIAASVWMAQSWSADKTRYDAERAAPAIQKASEVARVNAVLSSRLGAFQESSASPSWRRVLTDVADVAPAGVVLRGVYATDREGRREVVLTGRAQGKDQVLAYVGGLEAARKWKSLILRRADGAAESDGGGIRFEVEGELR